MGRVRQGGGVDASKKRENRQTAGAAIQGSGTARRTLHRMPDRGSGMSGAQARGSSVFSRRCEGKADVFSFALQIAYPAPEGRAQGCGCRGY